MKLDRKPLRWIVKHVLPKCDACGSDNMMVFHAGAPADKVIVIFGCRDCKELTKREITFEKEEADVPKDN
jgi:hypothetical protein